MAPEQIARRKETRRKQKCRAVKRKEKKRRGVKHSKKSDCSKENKASVSEHSIEQRKLRPCCGRRYDKCKCEPSPGMRTGCLSILAKRYVRTPLNTFVVFILYTFFLSPGENHPDPNDNCALGDGLRLLCIGSYSVYV